MLCTGLTCRTFSAGTEARDLVRFFLATCSAPASHVISVSAASHSHFSRRCPLCQAGVTISGGGSVALFIAWCRWRLLSKHEAGEAKALTPPLSPPRNTFLKVRPNRSAFVVFQSNRCPSASGLKGHRRSVASTAVSPPSLFRPSSLVVVYHRLMGEEEGKSPSSHI